MTVTLVTYDWVPEFPRTLVRDFRVRWVLEELAQPYNIETVPLNPKSDAHCAVQPFGQVPVIRDDDLSVFESGAILIHLGEDSALMPDAQRAEVIQWMFAALNTLEMVSGSWMQMVLAQKFPDFFGPAPEDEVIAYARQAMNHKLRVMQEVLDGRNWLVGDFSVADIAMSDVLRAVEGLGALADWPGLSDYVARAKARPAFQKAMHDQMAHWQAADEERQKRDAG